MANAIYRQTLAVQAATAVKADALKAQQHLAVVAMKEAANVAANAEAATEKVDPIVKDQVDQAVILTNAVAEAVRVGQAVQVDQVQVAVVVAVQAVIARVDQVRDNNRLTDVRLNMKSIFN